VAQSPSVLFVRIERAADMGCQGFARRTDGGDGSWPCENLNGRATRRNISEQLHLWESNPTSHARFDNEDREKEARRRQAAKLARLDHRRVRITEAGRRALLSLQTRDLQAPGQRASLGA
jgi:hypothetical protein